MPELSREEKIAAAQKKLREFQAAKAKKQSIETYTSQSSGYDAPASIEYQADYLLEHGDYHYTLSVDKTQSIQGQQKQNQQDYCLSSAINADYINATIYQPQSDASSVIAAYGAVPTSLTNYFTNPTNYYFTPSLSSLPNNNDSGFTTTSSTVSQNCNDQGIISKDLVAASNLNDQSLLSSTSISAFQIPNRIPNQSVLLINTSNTTELNSLPHDRIDGDYQNKINFNSSFVSPTFRNTSSPTCNANSSNQLHETAYEQVRHLENEVGEKVAVEKMPTAATEKLLQLTRQLDGILETSERLTSSLHTSGATSPLVNEFCSLRTSNNGMQSSPLTLLEPYNYPESNQQHHQTVESYEQQQKEFVRSTPNSLSGQSFQMCSGQNALVRELEERNVELASMLEKRNRAFEGLQVKLESIKEQYERRYNDMATERTNLQNSSQRDLEKTREQIRAHAKTIGVLVAEKTELQSQITHLDNLAAQRLKEIEETNARLKTSRQQILDLERSAAEGKAALNELQTGNNKLQHQIERLQTEIKREKNARQNLEDELSETSSRLTAKSCQLAQMGINLNELKQQLELSQIYANQLGSTEDSLIHSEKEKYRDQQEWFIERADLQNRLKELELSLSSADTEKGRLESQYRNYVAQVEQQCSELRSQLSETNKLKQELELSLESVNRQLREKDDEINDLTCRLNSVQMCPSSLPVQTQSLTSASSPVNDEQILVTSSTDQSSIERIESLECQLKHRSEELDNSTSEIQRLNMQLCLLHETVEHLQSSLADRDNVLATATSERTALSRAMEQNKSLKQQLSDLQDAYSQMSETNVNLTSRLQQLESDCQQSRDSVLNYQKQIDELHKQCDTWQSEVELANEMNSALFKQIEHLNVLQTDSLNQAVNATNSSASFVDNTIQTDDIKEEHGDLLKIDHVQGEQKSEDISMLLTTLETNQVHLNQLTEEVAVMRSLLTRFSTLCHGLKQIKEQVECVEFDDPAYFISLLEEYVNKQSQSMNDTSAQCSLAVERTDLEEFQKLQVAHTQLEAKFLKCMEELSCVSDERSRLESINAQLEMEATTVGEYVTLFTHRRAGAAKRARARELLLQRLVDDRRRLRVRLQKLYTQVKPAYNQDIAEANQAVLVENKNAAVDDAENFSSRFLDEFQNLIQEIEPSVDEAEFESGLSNLNDEDIGELTKDSADKKLVPEHFVPDDLQKNNYLPFSSSLESLRYHALHHDCPHCKCCVGTLLEV
ncbi:unnamed protein product [Heterobilharzia americana]|nr:unnamed protein product [Heterobilharzia americana]